MGEEGVLDQHAGYFPLVNYLLISGGPRSKLACVWDSTIFLAIPSRG